MAEATRKVRILKYSLALAALATSVGLTLVGCSDTDGEGDASVDGGKDSTVNDAKSDGTTGGGTTTGGTIEPSDFLLNEVKTGLFTKAVNSQFIELLGPAGTAFPANTYVIALDGRLTLSGTPRPPNPDYGKVLYTYAVPAGTKAGSNGLVLVQASDNPYTAATETTVIGEPSLDTAPLPQNSATFILATASGPLDVVGKVYADLTKAPGYKQLDAIAYGFNVAPTPDNGFITEQANVPNNFSNTRTPAGIARYAGNLDPQNATAWWGGRLLTSDAGTASLENTINTAASSYPLPNAESQPPSPALTPGKVNPAGSSVKPDGGAGDGGAKDGGDGGKDGSTDADAGDSDAAD